MSTEVREALRKAIIDAIHEIGLGEFKKTSLFMSSGVREDE